MKKFVFPFIVTLICYGQPIGAQNYIVDLNSEKIYNKVFVETDNFGMDYLDILEATYVKVKVDSIKFSILNDLAYYWHTRNLSTALKFTEIGIKLASEKEDSLWHGRFQITKGSILLRQEKLDSAEIVLEDAKTKVQKSDLPFLHTQLGYVYERRGELDKAADHALIGLEIGKGLQDLKAQALAYSDLSNLFWKQSKFEKGLEFGLKSLELFEQRNINDLDYDFTLYVVGNNYLALKNYDEALYHYNHSKVIGERYGFYNNLSDIYISLTDLHSEMGNFVEAEKAGGEALKYAQLLDNEFMEMRSWLAIGKLNNVLKDYDKAINSLHESIEIATENFGDEFFLSEAYSELAKAYYKNQDFKKAYEAQIKYDQLQEAIFTEEADQRINLLQTEFDVAQKEDTIALQEAEIEKQQIRQMLILIISFLLLLFLIALIYFLRKNRKKNVLLQKQNEEKAFLLKEIHHRVKNNLEIVSGLLALQSEQLTNQDMVDTMQESQNRVQSMSLIHQKLYQGKDLASIEMKDYLYNLGQHVLNSYGAENRINLKCVMDNLELDVDTAIPLGLIVNELLTNSMKYAFPSKKNGIIKIALEKPENNILRLQVEDNGVGIVEGQVKGTGFGSQLIELLNQQLNGTMTLKNDGGTLVSFTFNLDKAA